MNSVPLLRILLPLVLGIIAAIYFPVKGYVPIYLSAFFFLILLLSLSLKTYRYRSIFGILVHLTFLFVGFSLTALKTTTASTKLKTEQNQQYIIAEVINPITIKEKTVKAELMVKGIKTKENWLTSSGKVVVYLQKDSLSEQLALNDIISFEPKLKDVPPPQNPNEFDFRNYLAYHLIYQQAFLRASNWTILKKSSNLSLFAWATNTRKKLIATLNNLGIKNERLSVASALILGYKDDIDAQLQAAYSSAGAMHVLAVSGLHVGIIFLIFNTLLNFLLRFKYGNITKGIFLLLALWTYALLTGLSPSVMRAATMFSFIVGAKMTNRNGNFFNTLAASGLVLLIYNPLYIMEVGFQLSYLAVIGIVVIQPWVYNLFYTKWWLLDKIWEITAVSIAAQIATFPLGLYYFHQFPNYFLFSNLIVIPLAMLILYLGLLVLAISPFELLATYLAKALNFIIRFLNEAVVFIDNLPYSLSQNIKFSIVDNYLTYSFIILIILTIHYRKFIYLKASFLCAISFLIIHLLLATSSVNQKVFTVYNIPQHTAVNFIDGDDNVLISDIKLMENKSKLLFHVQNNWINKGIENEKIITLNKLIKKHQLSNLYTLNNDVIFNKRNYFQFYDKTFAILTNNFKLSQSKKPLAVDYLILTKNINYQLKDVLASFKPKMIVIDASNSTYVADKLIDEAKNLNLTYWSIPHQGAFEVVF